MRLLAVIFVVLCGSRDGTVAHAQDVLILTDSSTAAVGRSTHVTSEIAAFTNAGASVVVNSTELTNGAAMAPALVAGLDVVIVVSVSDPVIDAADVPVLQVAVNASASRAFTFFTDSCSGCSTTTTTAVLPVANSVGGWSVTLGSSDYTVPYVASLHATGTHDALFAGLPTIQAGAYAPRLGVPAA